MLERRTALSGVLRADPRGVDDDVVVAVRARRAWMRRCMVFCCCCGFIDKLWTCFVGR